MISISEAYEWLNWGDRSHLSAADRISLSQIADRFIPAEYKKSIVSSLRTSLAGYSSRLQQNELHLSLAVFAFEDGDLAGAASEIQTAIEGYRPASHRLAVALWMMGIVHWKLMENDAAYNRWFHAREIFTNIGSEKMRTHDARMVNWYYGKIDAMRLDMASTAEEALQWLYFVEKSRLSSAVNQYMESISQRIRAREYPIAYEIGLRLSKLSRNRVDTTETAEAWLRIGLLTLQMGNPRQAVEYFQRGAAAFAPWGHHQAVARWMAGIACWQIPGETDKAVNYWHNAMEAFQGLMVQADRDNNQKYRDWYELHIQLMKRIFDDKLRSAL